MLQKFSAFANKHKKTLLFMGALSAFHIFVMRSMDYGLGMAMGVVLMAALMAEE